MERQWNVPALAAFVSITVIGAWVVPTPAEILRKHHRSPGWQLQRPGLSARPPDGLRG